MNEISITPLFSPANSAHNSGTTYPDIHSPCRKKDEASPSFFYKFSMRTQHGLTLVELMVTLAVLAILIGVAAPNFTSISSGNKLTGQINALAGDIAMARSEAITRNDSVTIAAIGGDWHNGWTVTTASGTLRVADALSTTTTVTLITGGTSIIYNGDGSQTSGTVTIRLCDNTRPSGNHGKSVNVIASGRHSVTDAVPC